MANDNLQLIIGTVPAGYDWEIVKQMAKAMSNAIDQFIIEELTQDEMKWDQKIIIDINQPKNYQQPIEYILDYKSLKTHLTYYYE